MTTADNEPAISALGLNKAYGAFRALRGIDLAVRRGEIFGFLGPNGAGKTTAIRCMLDLIRPGGGSLRVLGLDPQREPVAVRSRCGYLPGELRLDENLRAGSALSFFAGLRGGGIAISDRAGELANRLGLDLAAGIKNLSKGNKQKVGIVAAFMHAPELLLLDEPTSGLDPLVQQTVLELVREARDRGATVFFSSHVLAEVQGIADRVAIIRRGEIVAQGATAELIGSGLQKMRVTLVAGAAEAAGELGELPGVTVAAREGDRVLELAVEGAMDAVVKRLAAYQVESLETERPGLEEVFLAHYEGDGSGGEGAG